MNPPLAVVLILWLIAGAPAFVAALDRACGPGPQLRDTAIAGQRS